MGARDVGAGGPGVGAVGLRLEAGGRALGILLSAFAASAFTASAGAAPLAGQSGVGVSAQAPCVDTPGFDRLDFWVGEWEVRADGRHVGTNRISRILDGCAVLEEWTGAGGGEGRSLFYFLPATGQWKQVWVTDTATRAGGVKEKVLVGELPDGSLRFQGLIPAADGAPWHDRTTLTPLAEGRVRQVIEISRDGEAWQTTFDAVYVPRGG